MDPLPLPATTRWSGRENEGVRAARPLLARIEDRQMHFLAPRGTDLGELVDEPGRHLERARELVVSQHPEADSRGVEPTMPAFPRGVVK